MSKTYEAIVSALSARATKLEQDALDNQVKHVKANIKAIDTKCAALLAQHKVDFSFIEFAPSKAQRESAYSNIIADKTLTKWRQLVQAVAHKNASLMDGYTLATLRNMLHLDGTITNREMFATISNDANYEEGALRAIKVRMGKGGSTAGAQAPTTRHALVKLGVCEYDEANRVLSFRDSKLAEEVKELLS